MDRRSRRKRRRGQRARRRFRRSTLTSTPTRPPQPPRTPTPKMMKKKMTTTPSCPGAASRLTVSLSLPFFALFAGRFRSLHLELKVGAWAGEEIFTDEDIQNYPFSEPGTPHHIFTLHPTLR